MDNTQEAPSSDVLEAIIKPLKWLEPDPSVSYPNWHAQVVALQFSARIDTSRALMFGKFPLSINGWTPDERFDTLEEAKAFAEQYYRNRVLELLDLSALASQTQEAPSSDVVEALDMAVELIQEAKGAEGPNGGFVTNHLDAAEGHLNKVRAALASTAGDTLKAENERYRKALERISEAADKGWQGSGGLGRIARTALGSDQ